MENQEIVAKLVKIGKGEYVSKPDREALKKAIRDRKI